MKFLFLLQHQVTYNYSLVLQKMKESSKSLTPQLKPGGTSVVMVGIKPRVKSLADSWVMPLQ